MFDFKRPLTGVRAGKIAYKLSDKITVYFPKIGKRFTKYIKHKRNEKE